jgi:steroid delta-isomerase-like uncharacterized protein
MSVEHNKTIARRFAEIYNRGGLAIVDELAGPDLVVSYPLLPEDIHGLQAYKQVLAQFYAAFPDIEASVEEMIAEGEKVVARWTCRGTHRGDFPGLPATGKTVQWSGMTIYRIVDGKVVEEKGEEDVLGLLQQLGVIPQPQQAGA